MGKWKNKYDAIEADDERVLCEQCGRAFISAEGDEICDECRKDEETEYWDEEVIEE